MLAVKHTAGDQRRRPLALLGGTHAINPAANPTNFDTTFRLTYTTGPAACQDVQVVLAGWTLNIPTGGELPASNDVTYKLSIEYLGVVHPVFFPGGIRSQTVTAGTLSVPSLPLQLPIPANTQFFVRVEAKIIGTGFLPETEVIFTNTFTAGDNVDLTGALGSSTQGSPGPVMVLGRLVGAAPPTVAVVGNSIAEGYYTGRIYYSSNNGHGDSVVNRGYIRAALGSSFSNVNVACPGELVQNFSNGGSAGRLELLRLAQCDYVITEYGSNDLYNGRTDVQTETDLVTAWTLIAARCPKGVFQCTILPRSTSTDGWATTTNQAILTPSENTFRISVNTWLRGGAPLLAGVPVAVGTTGAIACAVYDKTGTLVSAGSGTGHPLAAVFEIADLGESARNSGLWPAGSITTDGVHPNGTGVPILSPGIKTSLLV